MIEIFVEPGRSYIGFTLPCQHGLDRGRIDPRHSLRALKNCADNGITGAGNDLDFSAHHRLNGNTPCAEMLPPERARL